MAWTSLASQASALVSAAVGVSSSLTSSSVTTSAAAAAAAHATASTTTTTAIAVTASAMGESGSGVCTSPLLRAPPPSPTPCPSPSFASVNALCPPSPTGFPVRSGLAGLSGTSSSTTRPDHYGSPTAHVVFGSPLHMHTDPTSARAASAAAAAAVAVGAAAVSSTDGFGLFRSLSAAASTTHSASLSVFSLHEFEEELMGEEDMARVGDLFNLSEEAENDENGAMENALMELENSCSNILHVSVGGAGGAPVRGFEEGEGELTDDARSHASHGASMEVAGFAIATAHSSGHNNSLHQRNSQPIYHVSVSPQPPAHQAYHHRLCREDDGARSEEIVPMSFAASSHSSRTGTVFPRLPVSATNSEGSSSSNTGILQESAPLVNASAADMCCSLSESTTSIEGNGRIGTGSAAVAGAAGAAGEPAATAAVDAARIGSGPLVRRGAGSTADYSVSVMATPNGGPMAMTATHGTASSSTPPENDCYASAHRFALPLTHAASSPHMVLSSVGEHAINMPSVSPTSFRAPHVTSSPCTAATASKFSSHTVPLSAPRVVVATGRNQPMQSVSVVSDELRRGLGGAENARDGDSKNISASSCSATTVIGSLSTRTRSAPDLCGGGGGAELLDHSHCAKGLLSFGSRPLKFSADSLAHAAPQCATASSVAAVAQAPEVRHGSPSPHTTIVPPTAAAAAAVGIGAQPPPPPLPPPLPHTAGSAATHTVWSAPPTVGSRSPSSVTVPLSVPASEHILSGLTSPTTTMTGDTTPLSTLRCGALQPQQHPPHHFQQPSNPLPLSLSQSLSPAPGTGRSCSAPNSARETGSVPGTASCDHNYSLRTASSTGNSTVTSQHQQLLKPGGFVAPACGFGAFGLTDMEEAESGSALLGSRTGVLSGGTSSTRSPMMASLPSLCASDTFVMRADPAVIRRIPRTKVPRLPGCSMRDWSTQLAHKRGQLSGQRNGSMAPPTVSPQSRRFTAAEVAQHRTPDDLWMVIRGVVYDCTQFQRFHPGGEQLLMECAGRDATAVYDAFHPWISCEGMLGPYAVGVLCDAAGTDSLAETKR